MFAYITVWGLELLAFPRDALYGPDWIVIPVEENRRREVFGAS